MNFVNEQKLLFNMKKIYWTVSLNLLALSIIDAHSQDTPNVLIIHTDEHNFRTLGCYRALMQKEEAEVWGNGIVVETPNIDYLAAHGIICSDK